MSDPPPPYPGGPVGYPPPEKGGAYPPQQPTAPYPQQGPYPGADGQPPPPPGIIHPQAYGPTLPAYGPPPPGGQAYGPPPPGGQGYGPLPPPPPMTQAMPCAQATTVIIQQTPQIAHFREMPIQTWCPKCNAEIVTSTHFETGNLGWMICLLLCLFGCVFGCCLIPFCMDNTKDIVHTCPNCCHCLGRYSRM